MTDVNHRAEANRALAAVDECMDHADLTREARGATYTEENYIARAGIWANVAIAHALLVTD